MWSYQSIQTKFIPCSNTRGSRVKATTSSGLSATVSFDHGLRSEEAHWEAVKALLAKHDLNWGDKFAIGSSIDGKGYVFVPVRCGDNFAILEG